MKRAATFTLFILVCAVPGFSQSKPNLATPEATVKSFVSSFNRSNLSGCTQCVVGGKFTPEVAEMQKSISSSEAKLKIANVKTKIRGNAAVVTLDLKCTDNKNSAPPEMNGVNTINLKRVGNSWLIIPGDLKEMGPNQIPKNGLISVFAALFVKNDFMNHARGNARQTVCMSNIKQLALGIMMLVQDNDEKLNLTAANWTMKITPYTKSKDLLTCPEDKKGTLSYSFNAKLQGIKVSEIAKPAETVLLYEGNNQVLNFRHAGKACVAFGDGHVKMVTAAAAKSLCWKP